MQKVDLLTRNRYKLYRFRLDGNDKVKVNNSPFPNGPLPIPNGITGIDITPSLRHKATLRRRHIQYKYIYIATAFTNKNGYSYTY